MKKAITLIETVVSIVIMGIVAVTLVVLIANSTRQEIVAGQSDILHKMLVLVRDIQGVYWDKAAHDADSNTTDSQGYNVLKTMNGDTNLACQSGRKGFFSGLNRRHCYDSNDTNTSFWASNIPDNNTSFSYVEGYNGYTFNDTLTAVNYNVAIRYVDDNCTRSGNSENCRWVFDGGYMAQNQSTNLKRVSVTATRQITGDQNYTYRLYFFTSNVGWSKPNVR